MKTILLILLILWATYSNAQQTKPQVIATSGNANQQGNTTISYTIGESTIHTLTSPNITLTQGFQQPHYNITQINPQNNNTFNINVFPNPANDELYININNSQPITLNLYLFDIAGKLIISETKHINQKQTLSLPMNNIASGKYLLNVQCIESKESFSFEIIKAY